MNRRTMLKTLVAAPIALGLGGTAYGFYETGNIQVVHIKQPMPRLPKAFENLRIALLTDVHNGPYNDDEYLRTIVRTTNLLEPDLILHGGDYSVRDKKFIGPCFESFRDLDAPLGMFGVLGNHDYAHGLKETREGLKRANIEELTNAGAWITRGSDRLRIVGLDDLLYGKVDIPKVV
jgi:uncharacterized protein